MFQILVCLEQGFAGIELDQDTSYRPDVTREGPAGTCYILKEGGEISQVLSGVKEEGYEGKEI